MWSKREFINVKFFFVYHHVCFSLVKFFFLTYPFFTRPIRWVQFSPVQPQVTTMNSGSSPGLPLTRRDAAQARGKNVGERKARMSQASARLLAWGLWLWQEVSREPHLTKLKSLSLFLALIKCTGSYLPSLLLASLWIQEERTADSCFDLNSIQLCLSRLS